MNTVDELAIREQGGRVSLYLGDVWLVSVKGRRLAELILRMLRAIPPDTLIALTLKDPTNE